MKKISDKLWDIVAWILDNIALVESTAFTIMLIVIIIALGVIFK